MAQILPPLKTPVFQKQQVQDHRKDGYWIETFPERVDSAFPDIIGYGLATGDINVFHNPHNSSPEIKEWKKTLIQEFIGPVGMDKIDLTGNGLNDVIICHNYGDTMVECDPNGGFISWLQNPGPGNEGKWASHKIGRIVSMHRLRIGHFTRLDRVQVLALPIVGRPYDLNSSTPVLLFTQPANVLDPAFENGWPSEVVSHDYFHVIHDARVHKYKLVHVPSFPSPLVSSRIYSPTYK
jgi:hypothetical protein